MEYLILFLCCLRWSRKPSWHKGADPFNTDLDEALKRIDEYERRVFLRLKNADDYFNEYERTGDESYREYAIQERDKALQMIKEFKRENGL